MKYLLSALLFISLSGKAQQSPEGKKSNLETFTTREGHLYKKTYETVGATKRLTLQVLTIEDLTDRSKLQGLRIETTTVSAAYDIDSKIAFLDKDEIEGFLKSLNYFKTDVFPSSPANYTEVVYYSRSGFRASSFLDKKKWSLVLQLERFDNRSKVYLNESELDELIKLVSKAVPLIE